MIPPSWLNVPVRFLNRRAFAKDGPDGTIDPLQSTQCVVALGLLCFVIAIGSGGVDGFDLCHQEVSEQFRIFHVFRSRPTDPAPPQGFSKGNDLTLADARHSNKSLARIDWRFDQNLSSGFV